MLARHHNTRNKYTEAGKFKSTIFDLVLLYEY